MDDKEHSTSVSAVDQWIEIISTPELKTSLYYTLLLTISVILQLLADTFITRIVGKYGGDYATARGIVGTILGFAFYVFGFLTAGFTSKVSRVYGAGIKNDPILGAWIKTAVLSGLGAGLSTLLAFGPTYKLWLQAFGYTNKSPIFGLISVWYWSRLIGMTPNFVYNSILGVLQGMQMPLYIVVNNICLAIIDIAANWMFLDVFGWGPAASPMGINAAFVCSLIFALLYLCYGPGVKDSFTVLPIKKMLPWKESKIMFLQGGSLMIRSFLVELSTFLVAISCQYFGSSAIIAVTNVYSELTKYSYFIPSGLATAGIMLGGYLIGKGKIGAFNTLLTILPICAGFIGLMLMLLMVSTGPYYWTNFFLESTDDGFDSVYNYVKSSYWLILLIQPINAMLAVYEGLLFATQSFDFVRNVVVIGFTLIFLPFFLIGWFAGNGSITVIILAQTSYSLFRTICYGYKIHTSLIDELNKQIILEKIDEDDSDDSTYSSSLMVELSIPK